MNWRVYVKAAPSSPWRFTGVIESNRDTANQVWSDITRRLRYHAFKLEYCTYGVTIKR